ncbi:hypothetical protein JKP88DRAFT_247567 [Tribonema minus]|uniref:Uncharacterized protein n=1 Tax=Tribonema minus TaxID=303371 RepID=A0A835YQC6_9STRA|nr:hypothetical protein JKP88DRAFT_247567 [Tribonema minus]
MPTAVASLSYQPFPSRVDSSPTMCATLEHQDGTSSSSRDMRQAEPADIEYSDSSSCESDDQQATDDEEEPELHSRTRVRDGGDAMDTTSDRMRSPQHASSAPATVTRSTRLRSASIAAMGSSNSGDADAGRSRADSSSDKGMSVRKGKWTPEEEAYTSRIIRDFNNGYLPLPPGTTLRTYLSDKLSCDPMRITKKFAGAACIGKRVFAPCEKTPDNMAMVTASKRDCDGHCLYGNMSQPSVGSRMSRSMSTSTCSQRQTATEHCGD